METEWMQVLQSLNGSKEAIRKSRAWALDKTEQGEIAPETLVQCITHAVAAADISFEKALYSLFLIHDILFRGSQTQPNAQKTLISALAQELKHIVAESLRKATTDAQINKVKNLINLWDSRQVIPAENLTDVQTVISEYLDDKQTSETAGSHSNNGQPVHLPPPPPGHDGTAPPPVRPPHGVQYSSPQAPPMNWGQQYPGGMSSQQQYSHVPPPQYQNSGYPQQHHQQYSSSGQMVYPQHVSGHYPPSSPYYAPYPASQTAPQGHPHQYSIPPQNQVYQTGPSPRYAPPPSGRVSQPGPPAHSTAQMQARPPQILQGNVPAQNYARNDVNAAVQQAAAIAQQLGTQLGKRQQPVPPSQTLENLSVGNMADVIKTALQAGHRPYKPIDPHQLPPIKRKAVEHGRLEVRLKQFNEKVKKDEMAEERRRKREAKREERRRKREIRRQRRRQGLPSRTPSPDRGMWSSSESESEEEEDTTDQFARSEENINPFYSEPPIEAEEASTKKAIDDSNVGHKMLSKMGWKEGEGLGFSSSGVSAPIDPTQDGHNANERAGLGTGRPNHPSRGAASGAVETIREKGETHFADAVAQFRSRFSGHYHANLEQKRGKRR